MEGGEQTETNIMSNAGGINVYDARESFQFKKFVILNAVTVWFS